MYWMVPKRIYTIYQHASRERNNSLGRDIWMQVLQHLCVYNIYGCTQCREKQEHIDRARFDIFSNGLRTVNVLLDLMQYGIDYDIRIWSNMHFSRLVNANLPIKKILTSLIVSTLLYGINYRNTKKIQLILSWTNIRLTINSRKN